VLLIGCQNNFKMNRKEFLTDEFYSNTFATLTALNELVKQKLVADKDMYSSGTFLFMEVYDNEKSRKILSTVISDFDKYKEFNNSNFASDETTGIGLSALQDLHCKHFGNSDEIMWDNEAEEFELRCVLENDEVE